MFQDFGVEPPFIVFDEPININISDIDFKKLEPTSGWYFSTRVEDSNERHPNECSPDAEAKRP